MSTTETATETLAEARSFDELTESYRAEGLCSPCAARATYTGTSPTGCSLCGKRMTSTGTRVLRFLYTWTDHALDKDLASALDACLTDADRRACRAYAKARKAAPGWSPRKIAPGSNNHRAIPAELLAELVEPSTRTKACRHCGATFAPRGRAAYCGESCSAAARRGRQRVSR